MGISGIKLPGLDLLLYITGVKLNLIQQVFKVESMEKGMKSNVAVKGLR